MDLGPLPQPHAVAEAEPGHVDLHRAVEDVVVRPDVGVEGADVLPVALGHGPDELAPLGQQLREDLAGEVDRPVGVDVVEDLGLEHEDARC